MRINTNVSALNTLRNLANSDQAVASATAKLSSGFRINKAMDDAAGMRSRTSSATRAARLRGAEERRAGHRDAADRRRFLQSIAGFSTV
jgi:flagellin-like hook-associated protein FlgL